MEGDGLPMGRVFSRAYAEALYGSKGEPQGVDEFPGLYPPEVADKGDGVKNGTLDPELFFQLALSKQVIAIFSTFFMGIPDQDILDALMAGDEFHNQGCSLFFARHREVAPSILQFPEVDGDVRRKGGAFRSPGDLPRKDQFIGAPGQFLCKGFDLFPYVEAGSYHR